MIDIGPNLSHEQFNHDLREVILRASATVNSLILTSTDKTSFDKNLKIIEEYSDIMTLRTTYGLHPHYVQKAHTIFPEIDKHLSNPLVVAIGEFGLDYFRMLNEPHKQIKVMEKFLEAAAKNSHLGLFMHERDAFEDFYRILKNAGVHNKKVVHCFTGNTEKAKAYLDLDCFIGVTGWISDKRRNADITEALRYIPLEKLMIETDSPYLTPHNMPNKVKRNEPQFLHYVAKSVAEIKKISLEDVKNITHQNTLDFFNFNGYNNINNKILKL